MIRPKNQLKLSAAGSLLKGDAREQHGLFSDAKRATRLELASRYPTNCRRQFAGALPHLVFHMRSAHGWRQRVRLLRKNRTPKLDVLFQSGAGNEARTRLPVSHKLPQAICGSPAAPRISYALRAWVEAAGSPSTQKQDTQIGCPVSVWSGQRGSNSPPGIPQIAVGNLRDPCRTSYFICAPRIGGGSGFAFYAKTGHPNWMSCFSLERATRLELATSTLARWRSTR